MEQPSTTRSDFTPMKGTPLSRTNQITWNACKPSFFKVSHCVNQLLNIAIIINIVIIISKRRIFLSLFEDEIGVYSRVTLGFGFLNSPFASGFDCDCENWPKVTRPLPLSAGKICTVLNLRLATAESVPLRHGQLFVNLYVNPKLIFMTLSRPLYIWSLWDGPDAHAPTPCPLYWVSNVLEKEPPLRPK